MSGGATRDVAARGARLASSAAHGAKVAQHRLRDVGTWRIEVSGVAIHGRNVSVGKQQRERQMEAGGEGGVVCLRSR
jgi:hypothetical protein